MANARSRWTLDKCRSFMALPVSASLKNLNFHICPDTGTATGPGRQRRLQQFQLDVYGEILNALYIAHRYQIKIDDDVWLKHCEFLAFLETAWEKPDDGIWEARSGPRHFTESKVAAWVAFDRAVKLIEDTVCKGRWKNGVPFVTGFTPTFASTASTANATASCSITAASELDAALLRAAANWISCQPTIRELWARSRRFSAN